MLTDYILSDTTNGDGAVELSKLLNLLGQYFSVKWIGTAISL